MAANPDATKESLADIVRWPSALCVYSDQTKQDVFRRQHVEAIERRLRHAEGKNKALAGQVAKAKTSEPSNPPPPLATYYNIVHLVHGQ